MAYTGCARVTKESHPLLRLLLFFVSYSSSSPTLLSETTLTFLLYSTHHNSSPLYYTSIVSLLSIRYLKLHLLMIIQDIQVKRTTFQLALSFLVSPWIQYHLKTLHSTTNSFLLIVSRITFPRCSTSLTSISAFQPSLPVPILNLTEQIVWLKPSYSVPCLKLHFSFIIMNLA